MIVVWKAVGKDANFISLKLIHCTIALSHSAMCSAVTALTIRFVDCVTPEVEFKLLPITVLCQPNTRFFDVRPRAERSGGKTVSVLNPTGVL